MKLKVNSLLFTKNGKRHGNAIVTGTRESSIGTIYECKSDYGNVSHFTMVEIEEYFLDWTRTAGASHKYYTKVSDGEEG